MIPQTAFGFFGALSGPAMTTQHKANLLTTSCRIPHVLLWVWLNTLMFTFANQRLPDAVKEDKINKPYRPLAAGRVDGIQTRQLLLAAIPFGVLTSLYIGAADETILLTCLNWMYNELGGSDENFIVRNLLLGATYSGYCSGAVKVATGPRFSMNRAAYDWIVVIGSVIFTTMHVQDLKDQAGDNARGRKTAPLVLGDSMARLSIAISVLIWSVVCPAFWSLHFSSSTLSILLGLIVAYRAIFSRSVQADRTTWRVWSLWLTSLYFLPLMKDIGIPHHLFVTAR